MSITEPRKPPLGRQSSSGIPQPVRQLSQHSDLAKTVTMANALHSPTTSTQPDRPVTVPPDYERVQGTDKVPPVLANSHREYQTSLMPPPTNTWLPLNGSKPLPAQSRAMGKALTDTPMPSQPGSPQM
jgi:hypothetical protein